MTQQARTGATSGSGLRLAPPGPADGAAIHELIRRCPPLDLNSCYAYLLQGLHHASTCVIAHDGSELAGYVSAYCPPARPDTLFVWQVAVAPDHRGQGLARTMILHLLARSGSRDVCWLESTVTPGNLPSTRLFQGLAEELGCPCTITDLFGAEAFGGAAHEPEQLFRIGPFHTQNQK